MSDADSDARVPGLIHYITEYGIVDSVANRKSFRLAYVAGRTLTDALGMEVCVRVLWSRVHRRYIGYVCRVLPGDVHVPLFAIHQEELGNAYELVCGPHVHDCAEFMDTAPPNTEQDTAELNDAFLHTVESLAGDPAIPNAEKLAEFYIVENRQEGEGGVEDKTPR